MPRPSLSEIDNLPIAVIQQFRDTNSSDAIPEYLQQYIIHLDRAAELMRLNGSIHSAARKLAEEFKKEGLTFNTAKFRIYDAINLFYLNSTVKNEAWDQYYAERFEVFAEKNKTEHPKEARLAIRHAHDLRTKRDENAIDPKDLKIKDQLINPGVNALKLGITPKDLKKLRARTERFINELPLEQVHKDRLKQEAEQVIDVEHEEIPD